MGAEGISLFKSGIHIIQESISGYQDIRNILYVASMVVIGLIGWESWLLGSLMGWNNNVDKGGAGGGRGLGEVTPSDCGHLNVRLLLVEKADLDPRINMIMRDS